MGSVFNSIDNMLAASASSGAFAQLIFLNTTTTTSAGLTTDGYQTSSRYITPYTVPSLGTGVTSCKFPTIKMNNDDGDTSLVAALEYDLGSLTVSGDVFTSGVSMPTKTLNGVSVTTAASMIYLVCTASFTATTPVITITYTNQAGTGSRTATLTLPSGLTINTALAVAPHLQAGDTGIRSVQDISISTGSAGTATLYGLLPLAYNMGVAAGICNGVTPMNAPVQMWPCAGGENIGFYRFGANQASSLAVMLVGLGDN